MVPTPGPGASHQLTRGEKAETLHPENRCHSKSGRGGGVLHSPEGTSQVFQKKKMLLWHPVPQINPRQNKRYCEQVSHEAVCEEARWAGLAVLGPHGVKGTVLLPAGDSASLAQPTLWSAHRSVKTVTHLASAISRRVCSGK